ncbi:GTD2A protein, partial [Polyodon spathula]|nr:GTD2A protein [Polyodon spathula]
MKEFNLWLHYETKQRKMTTDTAQLSIFIWSVDAEFTITKELLNAAPMHGTPQQTTYFNSLRCVCTTTYHCILHQEALCGKVLQMDHIMVTVVKKVSFIRAKGLNHQQFRDAKRLCDLGFFCDITVYQGCKQVITEIHDIVKAFELKLHLLEKHMQQGKVSHFQACKAMADLTSHIQAASVMSMFSSTHLCEQLFSLMKFNKSE